MEKRARELAEAVFNEWAHKGTLDTEWMNPEDKEAFIGPMATAIYRGMDEVAVANQVEGI